MRDWRIINGDCLVELPKLVDGSIDMIMTDPPYGHNNNDGDLIANREKALGEDKKTTKWHGRDFVTAQSQNPARPILNDGPEANLIFKRALMHFKRLLSPGCVAAVCCSGGGGPRPMFARWSLCLDKVLEFKQMVVTDKGPMGMGWHYRRSYECVLVAMKPGAACRWYDESDRIENIIRPGGRVKKIIPHGEEHPTPKPPELAEFFLRLHAKAGDTILDPFCGRGWVGVAARKLGMKFIGIELDPHWATEAEKRLNRMVKGMFGWSEPNGV